MEKREARRARTWRHGWRTRRGHLRVVHPDGKVDCVCENSIWFFAKRGSVACGCRGRDAGNPKFARGLCYRGCGYRPAVVERIAGKRECRAWLLGG